MILLSALGSRETCLSLFFLSVSSLELENTWGQFSGGHRGEGGAESVLFSPKPDNTYQREKTSGMNAKPLLGYRLEGLGFRV